MLHPMQHVVRDFYAALAAVQKQAMAAARAILRV
jgi:hypothetical protein